jgi:hypothetical protein
MMLTGRSSITLAASSAKNRFNRAALGAINSSYSTVPPAVVAHVPALAQIVSSMSRVRQLTEPDGLIATFPIVVLISGIDSVATPPIKTMSAMMADAATERATSTAIHPRVPYVDLIPIDELELARFP